MSLSIATNVSALNASRHLGQSANTLDSVYRRLSSGLRINSAADDAAGLQISNRLTSEVNGTNTAIRNANDGISVINVADGALDESVNLMQLMRTLALQSGSGANTAEDRAALNAEFKQLQLEMDRIATGTRFAGQDLLAGSYKGIFRLVLMQDRIPSLPISMPRPKIWERWSGKRAVRRAASRGHMTLLISNFHLNL